jgi:hypothetical protein
MAQTDSNSSWLVQIYELSDKASQEILVGLLSGMPSVAVDAQSTSVDDFLIVDCVDALQAQAVFRMVTSVDQHARLVHTTNGPRPNLEALA